MAQGKVHLRTERWVGKLSLAKGHSGTARHNLRSLPSILPSGLLIPSFLWRRRAPSWQALTSRDAVHATLFIPLTFSHGIATAGSGLFHFSMPRQRSICLWKGCSGIIFVKQVSSDSLLSQWIISPSMLLLGCPHSVHQVTLGSFRVFFHLFPRLNFFIKKIFFNYSLYPIWHYYSRCPAQGTDGHTSQSVPPTVPGPTG